MILVHLCYIKPVGSFYDSMCPMYVSLLSNFTCLTFPFVLINDQEHKDSTYHNIELHVYFRIVIILTILVKLQYLILFNRQFQTLKGTSVSTKSPARFLYRDRSVRLRRKGLIRECKYRER